MPSLTRGWVCNLLVLLFLGLARAVTLGSKSLRTHGHILLSHLRHPQFRGPGPVFISPRNRVHYICNLLTPMVEVEVEVEFTADEMSTLGPRIGPHREHPLLLYPIVEFVCCRETCLFTEPLPSSGCFIIACCAIFA
jgi:hypothetical protein